MQPGLKLLIQLVIEFAPVIVNIIQKKSAVNLISDTSQIPTVIREFIKTVNNVTKFEPEVDKFTQHKHLQHQLAYYHSETQLKIAQKQQETALKLPEIHQILESWPLRLYPSQLLEQNHIHGRVPLKIFIAPPQVQFDKFPEKNVKVADEIELKLAEGLRDFINNHYSLHHPDRPTEFLAGAWDSKRFHSESSIKVLFNALKNQPTLILESENEGDYINFRIAYWGLGQDNYYYKTISRLSYREILQESAKNRAREWRKIRDQLLVLGEDITEINQISAEKAANLDLLEKEEKWQAQGIDINQLSLKYQINDQDWETLSQVLISYHSLVAAWVADAYHLVNHNVHPLLPELLPEFLKDALDSQIVEAIAASYQQIYQNLKNEHRACVPDLALQLAQSLSYLPNPAASREQIEYSINSWLQFRQIATQQVNHPLAAMLLGIQIDDEPYVTKLKEYFLAVNDEESIVYVERLLAEIDLQKSQPSKSSLQSINVKHTLTKHSGKITTLAISPDSEILVSGCTDEKINIWDLQKGNLIRTLNGNLGVISSLSISPDGNFLVMGSSEHPQGNVKVWHLKTGKLIHTLSGHQKPVNLVVISPDGQIVASGSNKIKIWNLQKGDRICTLWHSDPVFAAAISPDGTILASGSADTKIRLWNPRNGDPVRTLIGHSGEVTSTAISPDGKILYSGSTDKTIKIWHLETGKLLNTFTGHTDSVKCLAVSPDGQTIWSGSADQTIKRWCVNTGKVLQTLAGHTAKINAIALTTDGKILASGSSDQTIKIWQLG
ncbi:MAG TPA: WD40 repeat domain-containing protein [Nostocaceae cyanobacterium]|nr:WD40 repeat domain-containing protein [Nostocaceae cyanobacterium]